MIMRRMKIIIDGEVNICLTWELQTTHVVWVAEDGEVKKDLKG